MRSKKDFYKGVVTEVRGRIGEIQKLREKIRELERLNKSGTYSAQGIAENNQKIRELTGQIEGLRASGKSAVEDLCNRYESELMEADSLKGEEMTDDAKLLTAGVPLDKRDLESMLERNKGNRTMLQLALRYAKANNIDLGLTYVGNSETIESLKSIPYTAEVTMKWDENPSVFDRLMGDGSDLDSWASE